jgi:hypothetical protein
VAVFPDPDVNEYVDVSGTAISKSLPSTLLVADVVTAALMADPLRSVDNV